MSICLSDFFYDIHFLESLNDFEKNDLGLLLVCLKSLMFVSVMFYLRKQCHNPAFGHLHVSKV